jgi:gamma-glutamylputrescine oxidase
MKVQLSYWERESYFASIDVVIAGSGIVGLNAALALKKKNPQLKIMIAERGALPSGASTKNAGFACFGSVSELLDDLKNMSESDVFSLVEKRFRGLQRLRQTIGDAALDFQEWGGYELFNKEESFLQCEEAITKFNQILKSITGKVDTYKRSDESISTFGFRQVNHLILNTAEGQINTGNMMLALVAKAKEAGILVLNGLSITGYENEGKGLRLFTENGYTIATGKLLICTNGFAKELLPQEDVVPARAQVLITAPIENLKLRGSFHYDRGYYYFRNMGNRVLLGGGRNLDFKGEETSEHALTPIIQNELEHLLKEVILPNTPHEIEMRWSGTMGLGDKKVPIVKQIAPHVFCAVRMGGMGIALGSLTGEEVAEMVGNDLGN